MQACALLIHARNSVLFQQRLFSTTLRAGRERLVILGTGWGSYSVTQAVDKKKFDVIVISPRNHFLFTPYLTSTAVGTLEFRSIIEPIRNSKFRHETHYQMARAVSLNTDTHSVECVNTVDPSLPPYKLHYDYLVIGVGAKSNTFNVPGVKEHAFFLKELRDARRIRNRILENFELAVVPSVTGQERERLHHIVIVGGGPTGIEFGAELYDFIQQDIGRLYATSKTNVRVTLIESQSILSSFDESLQSYAERKIKQRAQFTLLKDSVAEVTAKGVKLNSGSFLSCGLVVWSTGNAPHSFVKSLNMEKNQAGQILTDDFLRVKGEASGRVWAIGDCADMENLPLPCTAQVAERQGRYLAQQLSGSPVKEFKFVSMGSLAYIGGFKAVSDLNTTRAKSTYKGFASWIIWKTVYLTKLGSWRLRFQVPMDLFKTTVMGRDTSKF